jgi:hypothetical protein
MPKPEPATGLDFMGAEAGAVSGNGQFVWQNRTGHASVPERREIYYLDQAATPR